EAIFDAIIKLRKKISNEALQERAAVLEQTHRYYSTRHNMKAVEPILTGKYIQSETRQAPPRELAEAMGMPLPAIESAETEEAKRG
ncbi:MAG: NADH-quinone oxidoreductase subunit B, partial [Pleurocapsa sp.]